MKSILAARCVRVPLTTMHQKDSPSREKAEGGGAPKGASNQCPRRTIGCRHPNVRGARKRPDAGGRSPSGAPPRRLPKRPNASAQPRPRFTRRRGRRRYPRRRSRLSGAPRTPVVVPEGTMPEPRGCGSQANSDNLSLYINYMTDSFGWLICAGKYIGIISKRSS